MPIRVLLYTRRACPLCEEAERQLVLLAARFPLALEYRNVDADPEALQRYGYQVPVGFVEGTEAFRYRVDAQALESLFLSHLDANDDQT